MKRVGTTTRIALAMAMWTATVLLAMRISGVVSDGHVERITARTRLAEAVAVGCSQFASRDDVAAINAALSSLKQRNVTIKSAACRQSDGKIAVQVGNHEAHWALLDQDRSTSTCIRVPVLQGDKPWGQVELCFESPVAAGIIGFLQLPSVRLALVATLANLLGFLFLLRRCFNHLDPSQAVPDRVRTALDTLAEGVLVLDQKYRINLANGSFAQWFGSEADRFQGQSIDSLPWQIDSEHRFSQLLDGMQDGKSDIAESVKLRLNDDDTRTLKPSASRIENDQGQCQGILLSLDDITVLEQKNEQLRYFATRDPMTSCLNRRSFFEHLETGWSSAQRYEHPLGCLMVDVDHFKSINDNHGHAVGDEVLKKVATTLLDTARDTDYVCRYGGEEFCVLLPHVDIEGTSLAAERYRAALEALQFPQLSVTASLGCSSIELGAESAEQMLEQADQSLYYAKRNGRNQVGRFDRIGDVRPEEDEASHEESLTSEEELLRQVKNLISDARETGTTQVDVQQLTEAVRTMAK